MESKMFCYQCQETAGGKGCTIAGVCGKSSKTAALQDLLIYSTKGLSVISTRLREEDKMIDKVVDHYISVNLFTTITNANFDDEVFGARILETISMRDKLRRELSNKGGLPDAAFFKVQTMEEMIEKAAASEVGVLATENEDVRALRELITYGLKGLAAYMKHANALGFESPAVDVFTQAALAELLDDTLGSKELVDLTLETGKFGVQAMALLDKANTETYGNPEMTKVNIGVGKNPGILISGHDLSDIEELLKQTQGTGIDIYTHGEMLPAHYYPELKKFNHLVGNYGNAWWKQKEEFEEFLLDLKGTF